MYSQTLLVISAAVAFGGAEKPCIPAFKGVLWGRLFPRHLFFRSRGLVATAFSRRTRANTLMSLPQYDCLLSTRALALLMMLTAAAPAQGALTAYLMNMPAPDGNGQFSTVGTPVLSNSGKMAFTAALANTSGGGSSSDRFGVFSMEPVGVVTQIARGLQTSPGGVEVFGATFTSVPLIGGNGDVAFTASRALAIGQAGVYRGAPLTAIAERLAPAPNGNGDLLLFSVAGVNQAGQVAFSANLSGTMPASADDGIFRGDGANLVEIVRSGDPTPGGLGQFTLVSTPKLNEGGHVAFFAQTNESGVNTGIFRGAGGAITPIVKQGGPAPAWGGGTDGVYSTLAGDLAFNDANAVVFNAKVNGSSSTGFAMFRSDGVNSAMIFKDGIPAPTGSGGSSGTIANFTASSMNNHGDVIAVANLTGTPGGISDNRGIFVSDGQAIRQVMRNGDPSPDGNGTLSISGNPTALVLNDRGQTIFQASHLGSTPGAETAIYFHDPEFGLKIVARTGQMILGQSVVGLAIVEGTPFQSSSQLERSGLNELGQVAFRFTLAGGAQGLAVWSGWSPADFNRDGAVDATDLAAWKTNFGDAGVTPSEGDANGDGCVDGGDFLVWQREFGANPAPAVAQIPEPMGWLLGAVAGPVFALLARKRVSPRSMTGN